MSTPYTPEQQEKIETVIETFQDLIDSSPYVDVLWSNKAGYVLFNIEPSTGNTVYGSTRVQNDETLFEDLAKEVALNTLEKFHSDSIPSEMNEQETQWVQQALQPYIDRSPAYRQVAERILPHK
jgi:hypothetical protein